MILSYLVIGMAIGAAMAYLSLWFRLRKDTNKYCPTCGRMLLIYEKELDDLSRVI